MESVEDDDSTKWPKHKEVELLQLLLKEKENGNFKSTTLQSTRWTAVCTKLNETGTQIYTKNKCTSKMDRLKIDWTNWIWLLGKTGRGWDYGKNTPDLDDEVWDNLIASRPKVKKFCKEGFEHAMAMAKLFNKIVAQGKFARGYAQKPLTS